MQKVLRFNQNIIKNKSFANSYFNQLVQLRSLCEDKKMSLIEKTVAQVTSEVEEVQVKKFMNLQTQHGNADTDEFNIVVLTKCWSPQREIQEDDEQCVWHEELEVHDVSTKLLGLFYIYWN